MTRFEIEKTCVKFYEANKNQIDIERAIRNTRIIRVGEDLVEQYRNSLLQQRKLLKYVKKYTKVCPSCKKRKYINDIIEYSIPEKFSIQIICRECRGKICEAKNEKRV